MNAITKLSLSIGALAVLISGSAAIAQTQKAQDRQEKLKIVEAEALEGRKIHADSQMFEIRVENGDVTVKHNGKVVPKDKIKQEDGRVIILDDEGNELKQFQVMVQPQPLTLR